MNTPDIRWHRAAEAAAPSFKLGQAMDPIVAAAARGRYEALITETERAFSLLFSGAPVSVLFRSGGAWREWSALEGNDDGCESILPAESLGWDRPHEQGSLVFVPITVGAVCLVVRGLCLAGVDPNELWALRQMRRARAAYM
ncbi:MAG: hypothetical protein KIT60_05140 [Burkholderiaceae bacterium]|nr:hypothetical protein [Burkholderiaceae bacterium]